MAGRGKRWWVAGLFGVLVFPLLDLTALSREGVQMTLWKLLRPRNRQTAVHAGPQDPGLAMQGWRIVEQGEQMTAWQDVDGDALTLTRQTLVWFPDLADENAVRRRCREHAQDMSSGLIEAAVVTGADGPAVMFVYKRLDKPAFVFTGMLVVAVNSKTWSVWTVVARERGTTGVREAVVTAQLMEEGKLTLESYRTSWAQDPYDPTYRGVDRSTLRYLSDDESYDAQFPEHPLSKVRRELRRLLAVQLHPKAPHRGAGT